MAAIRVLIVEDSPTVRAKLCEVLASDPALQIIGQASDGRQAIELCQTLRPDVITMDMVLPSISGLGATEHIMAHCPTPILVVSSSTNRGELFQTYEALAAGAVDVLEKPAGDEEDGAWERHLLSMVKLVSRIRVITHPRARLRQMGRPGATVARSTSPSRTDYDVVAIGASTGGPGAVLEILRKLPVPYPLPILLVVHIGEPFGVAFAEWLDSQTGLRVSYAKHGDLVSSKIGQVSMAPPGSHLLVANRRLALTQDAPRHSCRPSVDTLFESVAREYGAAAVGVLLTGMGRDGAAGLLDMRRHGACTIGQDEASSVVYGMPREAMLMGAVERELPLAEIAAALRELTAPNGAGTR
jgi:two-component system chemotaxis response regulator CheB